MIAAHVGGRPVVRLCAEVSPPEGEDFDRWLADMSPTLAGHRIVKVDPANRRVWLLHRHWTDADPMYQVMRGLTGDPMFGIGVREIEEMTNPQDGGDPRPL